MSGPLEVRTTISPNTSGHPTNILLLIGRLFQGLVLELVARFRRRLDRHVDIAAQETQQIHREAHHKANRNQFCCGMPPNMILTPV